MAQKIHKSLDGFSLFELLVSIGIIMTIMSLGLASFTRFNRKERVKQSALTLKANLRFVRTKSMSADKPTVGCTTFLGYRVKFYISYYTLQRLCTEGTAGTIDTVYLPNNVLFSPNPDDFDFIEFPLSTTMGDDQEEINLVGSGITYQIIVTKNGNIVDNGFQ